MRMDETKMNEINEQYKGNFRSKLNLKVSDGLFESIIVKNNWEICKLDELSTMIEELINLRTTIEKETGIKF